MSTQLLIDTSGFTVFTTKKGDVAVVNPVIGQTGWRSAGPSPGGEKPYTEVVYDKGGRACRAEEEGGAFYNLEPGWVTLSEQKERKNSRSLAWRKTDGPADYRMRHRRLAFREMHGSPGMQPEEYLPVHRHACG